MTKILKRFIQLLLWIPAILVGFIVLPTSILFGIFYWLFTGKDATCEILDLGPKIADFFHLFDE